MSELKFWKQELEILEHLWKAELTPNYKIAPQPESKSIKYIASLKRLMDKGLIEKCVSYDKDRFGSFEIQGFKLTHAGCHFFCDWCAKNYKEESGDE